MLSLLIGDWYKRKFYTSRLTIYRNMIEAN